MNIDNGAHGYTEAAHYQEPVMETESVKTETEKNYLGQPWHFLFCLFAYASTTFVLGIVGAFLIKYYLLPCMRYFGLI